MHFSCDNEPYERELIIEGNTYQLAIASAIDTTGTVDDAVITERITFVYEKL